MTLKIKLESPECEPFKKHKMDAGFDLRSNNDDFTLLPGSKIKVYTGVKVSIPPRHAGMILPRSGFGVEYEVGLANTVGLIDSDYRGELIVWLVNRGNKELHIKKYDRFCQLVVFPVLIDIVRVVDELDKTGRGEGGFGHTGAN
jgi:dUTP pyrophosphatase